MCYRTSFINPSRQGTKTSNIKLQTSNLSFVIPSLRGAKTSNFCFVIARPKLQTSNVKHQTSNIKHQTSNIKLQTSNQKPETRNEKRETKESPHNGGLSKTIFLIYCLMKRRVANLPVEELPESW
jgi:hypothetical protein